MSGPASGTDRPARRPVLPIARLARRVDPVIHERVRLGVLSALAAAGPQAFADLRAVLGVTDGNLFVHLRVCAEAGYVAETRVEAGAGRRARTEYRLTPRGRKAFSRYLDVLEGIVRGAGR